MKYEEIYSKIINLEPQTRMVTVCDNDGKIAFVAQGRCNQSAYS